MVVEQMRGLRAMELEGNPVCEVEGYREEVFKRVSEGFEILDGLDREGEEVNISENPD